MLRYFLLCRLEAGRQVLSVVRKLQDTVSALERSLVDSDHLGRDGASLRRTAEQLQVPRTKNDAFVSTGVDLSKILEGQNPNLAVKMW